MVGIGSIGDESEVADARIPASRAEPPEAAGRICGFAVAAMIVGVAGVARGAETLRSPGIAARMLADSMGDLDYRLGRRRIGLEAAHENFDSF
jgi:hypothetical protein